jgi:predicted nucleic acid-binding protein
MIIDTNSLSAWAEGDRAVMNPLTTSREIAITVITVAEYLAGVKRSRLRVQLESWLAAVLATTTVLPVTIPTAQAWASIKEELKGKGRPIPVNDMWIAALAIEYHMPVLSRDRHFDAVDGVTRISW